MHAASNETIMGKFMRSAIFLETFCREHLKPYLLGRIKKFKYNGFTITVFNTILLNILQERVIKKVLCLVYSRMFYY